MEILAWVGKLTLGVKWEEKKKLKYRENYFSFLGFGSLVSIWSVGFKMLHLYSP